MNRPDKPGELSIDEILASIRQKTSEASEAMRAAPDATPDEKAPAAHNSGDSPPPPPPPEAPTALLDRLNGVLKTGPLAGGANGSKRPLPFDQDLADMLDEPGTTGMASAAPKPEMRVTPELGSLGAKPPPTSDAPAGAAPAASPSPQLVPSAPLVPPPPFGRVDVEGAPPRPQSYGFPPLTKRSGFYPPQRSEPVLPPLGGESGTPRAAPASAPSPSAGVSAPSVSGPEAGSRLPDFGSLVPGDAVGRDAPAPDKAFGVAPRPVADGPLDEAAKSIGRVLPELDAAAPLTRVDPVAPSPLSAPAASFIPSVAAAPASAKPEASERAAPAVARAAEDRPSPATPREGRAPAAAAEDDKDAAAQALDALAQGLAAATAKSDTPAVALKPVPETAGGAEAASSAAPAAGGAAAPVRTLEDAVADMLRPMLQQWVQENMPRIMEKALRVEMAKTLGSGTKPSGS